MSENNPDTSTNTSASADHLQSLVDAQSQVTSTQDW